jgi:hypothetical protein
MDIGQDFKEFIELLNKHQVEYIVVGGYAVAMYGYPRYTGDIDFWVNPTQTNAKKIINALIEFGFGDLDINENDFNMEDKKIQIGFPPNRIDIITGVTGLTFNETYKSKKVITISETNINFISLYHLRLNKNSTGREKDINDLKNLPKE